MKGGLLENMKYIKLKSKKKSLENNYTTEKIYHSVDTFSSNNLFDDEETLTEQTNFSSVE